MENVNKQLLDVAEKLKKAGATVPAPQAGGTIESSMRHGLSIALVIVEEAIAATEQAQQAAPVELSVWFGDMPETNGKKNWTAILHRKNGCISEGVTLTRSEYPDRVRYEADRVRHLIGELKSEPDILAYDGDLHSGYVSKKDAQPPAVAAPQAAPLSAALADIAAERRRQIEQEGWTPEHDDQYQHGEMARAAACYALQANSPLNYKRFHHPSWWPFSTQWWKPSTTRRDLVKAGALIAAEIERIDRAAQKGGA